MRNKAKILILSLGPQLCTRSICQSGWWEIGNVFSVICWVPWEPRTRISLTRPQSSPSCLYSVIITTNTNNERRLGTSQRIPPLRCRRYLLFSIMLFYNKLGWKGVNLSQDHFSPYKEGRRCYWFTCNMFKLNYRYLKPRINLCLSNWLLKRNQPFFRHLHCHFCYDFKCEHSNQLSKAKPQRKFGWLT